MCVPHVYSDHRGKKRAMNLLEMAVKVTVSLVPLGEHWVLPAEPLSSPSPRFYSRLLICLYCYLVTPPWTRHCVSLCGSPASLLFLVRVFLRILYTNSYQINGLQIFSRMLCAFPPLSSCLYYTTPSSSKFAARVFGITF